MDIATIIGWVAGVAIVLQATGGEWAGLYNGTAVLVVVGGGLAATLVAFPLREALGALGAVKNVLVVRPPESAEMVERIVGYAEKARREGILSLEKPMADEPNMLTRAGIGLVVDGTEPDLIMDILETELHHVAERHAQRQRVVERTGRHWALFGGVGALLVLAQGGGVVGAVVPLLYGVLLYGLVGGAFARKLGEYHEREALAWKLVIEGVMAIQAGDNPRIIEHKLSVFLAPKDRPRGERKQVVAAPEKTPDIAPEEVERYLEEQRAAMLTAVREEVGKIAGDRGEKKAVEALVGRAEKGELGLMAVLGSLGPDLYANAMHAFNNPPRHWCAAHRSSWRILRELPA